MPVTVNGIGTHYYGKKNVETRPGVCRQCGSSVNLSSYDTRLWFVIVFVPIIPLGRKRILEYCPSCRRHFLLDLHKWETAKQLQISGALDKFRANPTPEAAIEAHQQLINFSQMSQAAEFRQMMSQKFAAHAKVQAYLGTVLAQLGRAEEAAACFNRALELRPDLPEARIGVARGHVRAQRLDEARKLLDFLEAPGSEQLYSLEPLEQLAIAYQQAWRHGEALALLTRLQQALPKISDHPTFRRLVATSEKALGRKETILPKRKFSWRRFVGGGARPIGRTPKLTWRGVAIAGGLAAVFVLVMAGANEYIRRHRTLYLLNSFPSPANVEVRGAGKVQALRGVTEMTLPEGTYHAFVTGPVRQEVDFQIHSGYFSRWLGEPAWVLNIGGASLLALQEAVYSQEPAPSRFSFHFGRPFESFPEVTTPFKPLPETLRMKPGEKRVLTQLEIFRGEMGSVFDYLQRQGQREQALRFAEWCLPLQPEDEQMLRLYTVSAQGLRQLERAEKFLEAGLTNRPVRVEWHRLYQYLRQDRQRDQRLGAMYDAMLKAEPTNSALLYLRGRLADDHAEGRQWFERAREADPRNPYPLYALGYDRAALGDWAGAKALLTRVVELKPKDAAFGQFLAVARLAADTPSSLEEQYRSRSEREPLNYFAVLQLCDVLVAEGKNSEAKNAVDAYRRAAAARYREKAAETANQLQRHLLYATADFATLEKQARLDPTPAGRVALFQALLEQGRLEEAIKVPLTEGTNDGFYLLTVALAQEAAHNRPEAEQWRARALREFENGDADHLRAAHLLLGQIEPTQAELDTIILPPKQKAIVLAALAQKYPEGAELAASARRLNVERDYPYHLIQRLTARTQ